MDKILIASLNGGGAKGSIAAEVVNHIETVTSRRFAEMFDIIAGTSTGGILTYGLTIGDFRGKDIVDLYERRAKDIFIPDWKGSVYAKYKNTGLIKVMNEYFGGYCLGDSKTRTITTASDKYNSENMIMKSWGYYEDLEASIAAVATSSAPNYFPSYEFEYRKQRVIANDGGIYAINPTLLAVAEALKMGYKLEDIVVLNIGTGYSCAKGYDSINPNKVKLLIENINDGLRSQKELHKYLSEMFLPENYYMWDIQIPHSTNEMDKWEYMPIWKELAKSNLANNQELNNFINKYLKQ